MRAFIQHSKDGQCIDINAYNAFEGFTLMGYEVIPFQSILEVENRHKEDVVLGHIPQVLKALELLSISPPEVVDYPVELQDFLGRKYYSSTLWKARNPRKWPIFVKPAKIHKAFTGTVFAEFKDIIATASLPSDLDVYISELVHFVSEYRIFVHKGSVIGCKHYSGDWRISLSSSVVEDAIRAYETSPVAYAIDFGVTNDGRTLLVEVNDFYSLGNYGLPSMTYALAIADRWKEMTS